MSRILYIRWGGICGFFFPFWNRHNPSIKENASDIHCLSEVTGVSSSLYTGNTDIDRCFCTFLRRLDIIEAKHDRTSIHLPVFIIIHIDLTLRPLLSHRSYLERHISRRRASLRYLWSSSQACESPGPWRSCVLSSGPDSTFVVVSEIVISVIAVAEIHRCSIAQ